MRHWLGFGPIFGWVGIFLVIAFQILFRVIIVRIVTTVIHNRGKIFKNAVEDEAISILRKKYANWEISKKEFTEKKKDLL